MTEECRLVRHGEFWKCSIIHRGVEIAQWGITQSEAYERTMSIMDLLADAENETLKTDTTK